MGEADNGILRGLFLGQWSKCIVRPKRNTRLIHKGRELKVGQITKKVPPCPPQTVAKVKKGRKVLETYQMGTFTG